MEVRSARYLGDLDLNRADHKDILRYICQVHDREADLPTTKSIQAFAKKLKKSADEWSEVNREEVIWMQGCRVGTDGLVYFKLRAAKKKGRKALNEWFYAELEFFRINRRMQIMRVLLEREQYSHGVPSMGLNFLPA